MNVASKENSSGKKIHNAVHDIHWTHTRAHSQISNKYDDIEEKVMDKKIHNAASMSGYLQKERK